MPGRSIAIANRLTAWSSSLICLFGVHGAVWGQSPLDLLTREHQLTIAAYHQKFCIETQQRALQLPTVAFGCATTDCCAGCPAIEAPWAKGAAIEVTTSGEYSKRVSLRFENLSPVEVESLDIPGGTVTGETEVSIAPGRTRIGVPRDFPGAIVITPVVTLQDSPGEGDSQPQGEGDGRFPPGSVKLDLDAILDEEALGGAGYVTDWDFCENPVTSTCLDSVILQNHTDTEPAVVLLDGNTDFGCVSDVAEFGMSDIPVGNFKAPHACRNEAVVFARDKAMMIHDDANSADWSVWTDPPGDKQVFALNTPRIVLPLNIQIAVPAHLVDQTRTWALQDSSVAQSLLNGNRMGIALHGTDPVEIGVVTQAGQVTAIENLVTPWIFSDPTCSEVEQLVDGISSLGGLYDPDKLNVYYLSTSFITGIHFRYCPLNPDLQPQGLSTGLIFVGRGASNTTLTHEIGHALSLGHVGMSCQGGVPCAYDYNSDGFRDFDVDNIMFVDFPDPRLFFTEGQAFRANANETSILNSNGYRTGQPIRACAEWLRNPTCPWLGLESGAP